MSLTFPQIMELIMNEYCEVEAGWEKSTEAYPELPQRSMKATSPELLLQNTSTYINPELLFQDTST